MIRVSKYDRGDKVRWDEFIARSKNGVFMFYRDYMDYHANRLADHSLLFFDESRLIAVMPANARDRTLISYEGLSFGGIISGYRMNTPVMLDVFTALREYLISQEVTELIYKTIPHIYHDVPAEEDLFALFLHNATLVRRDVSSTISMKEKIAYSKGRKWARRKSKSVAINIKQSGDFKVFIAIVEDHLRQRYGLKPTHTGEEMELLASRFPENIKLFAAYKADWMIAGVIVYESKNVAHAQYIAATEQGKQVGALDLILDFLINEYYVAKKYFDFGISTTGAGRILNRGLIQNKESYGARATVCDFYTMSLAR